MLTEFFYLLCLFAFVFGILVKIVGWPALNSGDQQVLALVCGGPALAVLITWFVYKRHVTHQTAHIGDGQLAFEKSQRQEQATHDKTWRLIYPDHQPDYSGLPQTWIPTAQDEAEAQVDFDLMKRFQAAWDEQHPEDIFDDWKSE